MSDDQTRHNTNAVTRFNEDHNCPHNTMNISQRLYYFNSLEVIKLMYISWLLRKHILFYTDIVSKKTD